MAIAGAIVTHVARTHARVGCANDDNTFTHRPTSVPGTDSVDTLVHDE